MRKFSVAAPHNTTRSCTRRPRAYERNTIEPQSARSNYACAALRLATIIRNVRWIKIVLTYGLFSSGQLLQYVVLNGVRAYNWTSGMLTMSLSQMSIASWYSVFIFG